MSELNDYECEISKSWALIDMNLDEKSPALFDSQDDCNSSNSFPQEKAKSVTENKDRKKEKPLESSKPIKIICNHAFDSNKNSHNLKVIATDKIQDKSIVKDNDNISDSSDSIEVLDSDNDVTDLDDSLSILNNNIDENGADNSNCIKLYNNKFIEVFDNNDRANVVRRKKKLLNIFSLHNVYTGDQYESFKGKEPIHSKDLRIAIYKAKSLTAQNCNSTIKNIAFNLLLVIFIVGILCFITGNILGIYESLSGANKSGKTMKNMELSLHLKEINAASDMKEMNIISKQNLHGFFKQVNLKERTSMTYNSDNNKICTMGNLSQPLFNSNVLKNLSRSKFGKVEEMRGDYEKKNVANFIKVLNYLYENFNSININYKDKAKCFEELIPVISKILEPILICVSSQNNTKMNYQKPDEITLKNKFNISSYVDKVINKEPVLVNQTIKKSESKSELRHTRNKTFSPVLTHSFPQRKDFYANEKNYYNEANDRMNRGELFNKINSKTHSGVKKKVKNKKFDKSKRSNSQENRNHIFYGLNKNQCHNDSVKSVGKHFSDIKNVPFKQINNRDNSNGYWQFERAESRKRYRIDYFTFDKRGKRNFKKARGGKDKNYGFRNWQFERAESRKHLRQNFCP